MMFCYAILFRATHMKLSRNPEVMPYNRAQKLERARLEPRFVC
jgi:hypothetical protein